MKVSCVALALSSLALVGQAWADVRTLHPVQHIDPPDSSYTSFGQDVAIDDGHMIVLGVFNGGQAALLYSRSTSTGPFVFERVLQSISSTSQVGAEVAMKNGIAVVRFGNQEQIYEFNGSTYVPATTAQPPSHPGGIAISGSRILMGGNGCEYGAVIYEKGTGGVWDITSRIGDQPGSCRPGGFAVGLSYDYALLRVPNTNQATAWHRNAGVFDWVPAGTLVPPSDAPTVSGPFALQNSTAVAPGNFVFRRSGTHWPQAERALADNFDNTLGTGGFDVVYRDGVLLTNEAVETADPYAYLETSPGHFEHVAVLDTTEDTASADVSKSTVVAGTQNFATSRFGVDVFQLPASLQAPAPILNDFETLDTSGFSFVGNSPASWSLAKRGTNDVLRQQGRSGTPIAVVNGSDWAGYRRIEADITPTYVGTPTGVGLIARFIDVDHYYYARVGGDNLAGIYRHREPELDTFIAGMRITPTAMLHVSFTDDGIRQVLSVNNQSVSTPASPSAGNGPAALMTDEAAADFDNVHVSATEPFILLEKNYSRIGPINGQDFTIKGGNWVVLPDQGSLDSGLAQTTSTGTALATIGVPVENQEIDSDVRLDAFNSSNTGAWYGFVARYQDSLNYYSVAVRSNGQVQIRKTVNGVVTILGSANLTPVAGQYNNFRFRLIHDELHLFVNGVKVAGARDGTFVTGQYGLATHYAQAKWQTVFVRQP